MSDLFIYKILETDYSWVVIAHNEDRALDLIGVDFDDRDGFRVQKLGVVTADVFPFLGPHVVLSREVISG